MKKGILIAGAVLFSALSFAGTTPAVEKVKVDTKTSTVNWTGKKVTGGHTGNIKIKSGELQFDAGKLVGGSFEIDMNSISCTDLSGKPADNLVGHLKSDDFFGVEKFNTSKLVIKYAQMISGNNYSINGDLTIKGITQPISFTAAVDAKTATAEIKVDRTKYDVKYGSGSFFDNLGDKAIDNDFVLNVKLATEAPAAAPAAAAPKTAAAKKTKKKPIKTAPARAPKQ